MVMCVGARNVRQSRLCAWRDCRELARSDLSTPTEAERASRSRSCSRVVLTRRCIATCATIRVPTAVALVHRGTTSRRARVEARTATTSPVRAASATARSRQVRSSTSSPTGTFEGGVRCAGGRTAAANGVSRTRARSSNHSPTEAPPRARIEERPRDRGSAVQRAGPLRYRMMSTTTAPTTAPTVSARVRAARTATDFSASFCVIRAL